MDFLDSFIVAFLMAVFNIIVYIIFKKNLYGKPDMGMRFLTVNIFKDILWLIISLIIIDKTKENLLFLLICFIVASFFIYLPVIKRINKS
jgi:hypothetical protein